ncbi:PDR/VanB family oxidoreductase [Methylobacterium sp. NEAU 140]|uniref:PDR/VanB family oxidoreductase n=1 Tax=Methylobacterium sp. NEAU 140 TaxID=3064945 RepID=UPI002735A02C|nr:PDR/VanB family oxidoreductase [Methylobacterium sp. NEAU 140]MDP4026740.1 PDR/VanB family oxidoreductase [Methylobacterium sp. NEAU 140]
MAESDTFRVRIHDLLPETDDIRLLDLRADKSELPPFTPGAHVDLVLPGGLVRSYSLLNAPDERHRYLIAVARDRASRGGSTYVHDVLVPGMSVDLRGPRNNFKLDETALHSVLIAGGIGVTPLIAMAHQLAALNRSWRMHYCSRGQSVAGFVPLLKSFGDCVDFWFDDLTDGRLLDIEQIVAASPSNSHFYCCGPRPMLDSFKAAVAHLPQHRVHTESFAPSQAAATAGGFMLKLVRSGMELPVPLGRSILDVLLEAKIDVPCSCMEGVCGTCETTVLEGVPDHRDDVLSQAEKAANKTMMVCCSGSQSSRLVLDL